MRDPDDDLLSTTFDYRGDLVAYGPSHGARAKPQPGMPVLVLGAQGRLGRELIQEALRREHTVTTLSRRPLELRHPRLRVVKGDVLDAASLETAMRGQQAVLVALGDEGDSTDPSRLEEVCADMAHAMRRCSVHRITWFIPALRSADARKLKDILLSPPPRAGRREPPRALAPLEWVMVRAHALTDAPARRLYEVTTGPAPVERPITRADVSDFMLAQLQQPRYAGHSVLLAEPEPPAEGR